MNMVEAQLRARKISTAFSSPGARRRSLASNARRFWFDISDLPFAAAPIILEEAADAAVRRPPRYLELVNGALREVNGAGSGGRSSSSNQSGTHFRVQNRR